MERKKKEEGESHKVPGWGKKVKHQESKRPDLGWAKKDGFSWRRPATRTPRVKTEMLDIY